MRVKKAGDEEHTFNVFIDLNKVGNALKQKEFARKLKSLLVEYHVDLETSTGHKSELEALFRGRGPHRRRSVGGRVGHDPNFLRTAAPNRVR